MALASRQIFFDPYDFPSDDKEYVSLWNVAETSPGRSDHPARILTATRLDLNSAHEVPRTWGQINPDRDDYYSDPMEISSTFWIPDITNWCWQQQQTHSKYADLSNVARDMDSILPHWVTVQSSYSLGRDDIGWRQS